VDAVPGLGASDRWRFASINTETEAEHGAGGAFGGEGVPVLVDDGNIEIQGQLDSNRNVGKWQYFYPNGELESEGYFNLDHPDGKWIWNYSDGRRKEEGEYINGNRIGMWYQFENNGEVIFEKNYDLNDTLSTEKDTTNI